MQVTIFRYSPSIVTASGCYG